MTRILSRKSWLCGKDDEFGLRCVELELPLGGQIGGICETAGNVACSWELPCLLFCSSKL